MRAPFVVALALTALAILSCSPSTDGTAPSPTAATPTLSPTSTPALSASPSAAASVTQTAAAPSRTGQPLAVLLLHDPAAPTSTRYGAGLFRADGTLVARISATKPSGPGFHLPLVSASRRFVYVLDGDTQVRSLAADGAERDVTRVPGSAMDRVVIAAKPDDSRLAVSLVHFVPPPPTCQLSCAPVAESYRLYVEDLASGKRSEILPATASAGGLTVVYPVGWSGERLITAVGPATVQNAGQTNPYFATEYHVADAASGARLATIAADCDRVTGPVVTAGTACMSRAGAVERRGWDGTRQSLGAIDRDAIPAVLSPDGSRAATAGAGTDDRISLVTAAGPARTDAHGSPIGWLDDSTFIYVTSSSGVASFEIGGRQTRMLSGSDMIERMPFGTYFATVPVTLQ
jgi:hypothetical protein